MYHSIDINVIDSGKTYNTYNDFLLVPTSTPVISVPSVKTKTIDIPGANGSIDLTESLTPYPVYNNRSGTLEFALLNDRLEYYNRYNRIHGVKSGYTFDNSKAWSAIYSDILNKIHGRKCNITLEDDPAWFYEGRIALNNWKSSNDGKWPVLSFDYNLQPYKLSTESSTDSWKWNPFSFVDGVTYGSISGNMPSDGGFKNISVNSSSWSTYGISRSNWRDVIGWGPVSPIVTFSSSNMGIRIENSQLGYTYEKTYSNAGTYTDPECILYDWNGSSFTINFKGTGLVTLYFRRASL